MVPKKKKILRVLITPNGYLHTYLVKLDNILRYLSTNVDQKKKNWTEAHFWQQLTLSVQREVVVQSSLRIRY